jgi:hypothetical protein
MMYYSLFLNSIRCFLLLFVLSAPARASQIVEYGNIEFIGSEISFTIITQKGIESRTSAESISGEFSRLEDFLSSTGRNHSACRNIPLVIHLISYESLNDRDKMSFLNWSSWGNLNVLGTYDSMSSSRERGVIYVAADEGEAVKNDTISHELVHYWQDITCNTSGNLEKAAMEFETLSAVR